MVDDSTATLEAQEFSYVLLPLEKLDTSVGLGPNLISDRNRECASGQEFGARRRQGIAQHRLRCRGTRPQDEKVAVGEPRGELRTGDRFPALTNQSSRSPHPQESSRPPCTAVICRYALGLHQRRNRTRPTDLLSAVPTSETPVSDLISGQAGDESPWFVGESLDARHAATRERLEVLREFLESCDWAFHLTGADGRHHYMLCRRHAVPPIPCGSSG